VVSRLGIRYNKGCSRQITSSVKNGYYLVSEPAPLVLTYLASRNKCQTSSLLFRTLNIFVAVKTWAQQQTKVSVKKHELLNSYNGLILFFRYVTLSAGFVVPDASNEHSAPATSEPRRRRQNVTSQSSITLRWYAQNPWQVSPYQPCRKSQHT
jgi:hypothetical protein